MMILGKPLRARGALVLTVVAAALLGLGAIGGAALKSAPGAALAETHEDGGGKGPPAGKGPGAGGHDEGGHDEGGHDEGGEDEGGHSGGKGGHGGEGGEGGGNAGAGQGGQGGGGRPAWAKEGIPEVELGRLNVARSPARVLDRAYAEALATFTPEMAAFYSLPFDEMVMVLSTEFRSVSMIDSPLQNLALFKDALDGSSALTASGVSNANSTLLAVFLGTASDKSVPISADTVTAVSIILGSPVDAGTAATLAAKAEAIRIAILAGHG